MTGRARRQNRALIEQRQAQQHARTADLPAVAVHPDAPPLDTAALFAPFEIVLSPNLAQPAPQPSQAPDAPEQPSRGRLQHLSVRLLEKLMDTVGEAALSESAVEKCIRAAERILR